MLSCRLNGILLQIAASLGAEKLILMTDVPGVMKDKDDVSTLYRELNIPMTKDLIKEGAIAGGMIPKVKWFSLLALTH